MTETKTQVITYIKADTKCAIKYLQYASHSIYK